MSSITFNDECVHIVFLGLPNVADIVAVTVRTLHKNGELFT